MTDDGTCSTPRPATSPARKDAPSPAHSPHHPAHRLGSPSGPLMPVVGRKTGLEGFLPESENLAGDVAEKEREEMLDEEDDGDRQGEAATAESAKQSETENLTSQVAGLSFAPRSGESPTSTEGEASPGPPVDLETLVALVDPAIKELPLPSPPPPGAYIFPDSQGRASFSADVESPPPAHSSEVLEAGASGKTTKAAGEEAVKGEHAGSSANPEAHPVLLLPSAFFASPTCPVCRRQLHAFTTTEQRSTSPSGEQAKEAVLRHWGCLRIELEEGKMGVGVGP